MLARRGFLHVENVFSPTTQASGFATGPEFTPDVSSLACLSGAIERVIWVGSNTTLRTKLCEAIRIAEVAPFSVPRKSGLRSMNHYVARTVPSVYTPTRYSLFPTVGYSKQC